MSFKIYTKTGDKGTTGLIGGTRVSKANIRIEAYGTVDELNSWLGILQTQLTITTVKDLIVAIQNQLFTIGSALACDPAKDTKMYIPEFDHHAIQVLEQAIDDMNEVLPTLKNFILPGGDSLAAQCHVARCVCRRAERVCVAMQDADEEIASYIIQYLNRLSDYLFVLSRYIVHQHQAQEVIWKPIS